MLDWKDRDLHIRLKQHRWKKLSEIKMIFLHLVAFYQSLFTHQY
jgi:hypothetical protein